MVYAGVSQVCLEDQVSLPDLALRPVRPCMVGPKQKSVIGRALPPTWCPATSYSCSGLASFCWNLSYLPRCLMESWQQSRRHRYTRAGRVQSSPSDQVEKTGEGK